jgi:uncharacterized protein
VGGAGRLRGMGLDEVLRCLAEADGERRRPKLCGGRYLAVAYGDGFGLDVSRLRELGAGEFEVRGGASSFYDALDLLAGGLLAASGESAGELLDRLDDDGAADDGTPLAGIVSPGRRLLARVLLGYGGPMGLVTGRFAEDFYLGGALDEVPDGRFVLLASAAPPNQEFAPGVLELGRGEGDGGGPVGA